MEPLVILLLLPLTPVADHLFDPAPGIWSSKQEARSLECRYMTQAKAHELYPDQVPEAAPRASTLSKVDALVCTRRIMNPGERSGRDEAILSSLRQMVGEISEVAGALGSRETTWHVDAFYPDPRVASKISVAARTELAERRRKVSDQVPLLAAGDLVVLRDLPAKDAYPLACKRYFDQQILGKDEAFLGIMLVDERETQLHAGVCMDGRWRWLR
jgi:hypothetical protein